MEGGKRRRTERSLEKVQEMEGIKERRGGMWDERTVTGGQFQRWWAGKTPGKVALHGDFLVAMSMFLFELLEGDCVPACLRGRVVHYRCKFIWDQASGVLSWSLEAMEPTPGTLWPA